MYTPTDKPVKPEPLKPQLIKEPGLAPYFIAVAIAVVIALSIGVITNISKQQEIIKPERSN